MAVSTPTSIHSSELDEGAADPFDTPDFTVAGGTDNMVVVSIAQRFTSAAITTEPVLYEADDTLVGDGTLIAQAGDTTYYISEFYWLNVPAGDYYIRVAGVDSYHIEVIERTGVHQTTPITGAVAKTWADNTPEATPTDFDIASATGDQVAGAVVEADSATVTESGTLIAEDTFGYGGATHNMQYAAGASSVNLDWSGLTIWASLAYNIQQAAAGSVELVVADAAHGHALDAPTLTQAHVLAVADMAHGHALDAPVLTQAHELAVADAAHGHALDPVVVSVSETLAPADLAHANALDAVALTQAHVLAVADMAHGHALEAPTLEPTFLLAVADALSAHTMAAVDLTQANVLAPADLSHAHTLDGPTLVYAATLVVGDLAHAQTLDAPTLSTALTLAPDNIAHTHALDGLTLTQAHQLVVAALEHGHALDAATLSTADQLAVADLLHAHGLDAVEVTQGYLLSPEDLTHAQALDAVGLTQANVLVVAGLDHAHRLEAIAFGIVLYPISSLTGPAIYEPLVGPALPE